MIRFTTASGAVYLYDKANGLIQRQEGPMNPHIQNANGAWDVLDRDRPEPEVILDRSVFFHLRSNMFRATTPVVNIEEV